MWYKAVLKTSPSTAVTIGHLRFPFKDGFSHMTGSTYSTIEVYGAQPVSPSDVPKWHVSMEPPEGATSVQTIYGGWDEDLYRSTHTNSDSHYENGRAQLRAGRDTTRNHEPATHTITLVLIPWVVQAQSQEVTPTAAATGENPPAQPTNLQASASHDSVTLTWTASTDQTVTHYAILRRNPDTDASQVFHVIESNGGPETSYTDSSVSASSTYIYRAKAVSPTGVSQWSGYAKADTPAAPPPTATPTATPAPTPEPESTPVDLAPSNLSAALAEDAGVSLTWSAPAEDADSVTGYEIQRAVGGGDMATLVADTASTSTSYTDVTATQSGSSYTYKVKAIRGEDVSQASGQAQVQLPHDPADLKPTGLTVSLVDNKVTLSWTAPAEAADAVDGYEILRAVGGGELATLAADTASTTTSYTDATATDAGEDRSDASGQAQVQLPHDPVDLAPTGLTAQILPGASSTARQSHLRGG